MIAMNKLGVNINEYSLRDLLDNSRVSMPCVSDIFLRS